MKAAHDAPSGAGKIVLHELPRQTKLLKAVITVELHEETPLVAKYLGTADVIWMVVTEYYVADWHVMTLLDLLLQPVHRPGLTVMPVDHGNAPRANDISTVLVIRPPAVDAFRHLLNYLLKVISNNFCHRLLAQPGTLFFGQCQS